MFSKPPFPGSLILSQTTNFKTLPNLKELAGENFEFDKKGRKLSIWVENTVGKGEIACYEQYLFSRSVFKSFVLQTRENQRLFGFGKWLIFRLV